MLWIHKGQDNYSLQYRTNTPKRVNEDRYSRQSYFDHT